MMILWVEKCIEIVIREISLELKVHLNCNILARVLARGGEYVTTAVRIVSSSFTYPKTFQRKRHNSVYSARHS